MNDNTVGTSFEFSPLGLVGGVLLVMAIAGSFQAVEAVGLALGQGIWGGAAMVVSYMWGDVVFHETPSNVGASIGALIMLVFGVGCIALCDLISQYFAQCTICSRSGMDIEASIPLQSDSNENASNEVDDTLGSTNDYKRGVVWALFVGLSGGSILAPLHYVPPSQQGLVFLPSFGIGAMLTAPLAYCLHAFFSSEKPNFHVKEASGTGLLSGLLWNIGNLLSIIGIAAIGYGVAYPIFQCAILVSGVWGIYVFHEIRETGTIVVFWVGGVILVAGGALLAMSQ